MRHAMRIWGVALLVALQAMTSQAPVGAQQGLPPEVVNYADTVLYNGKILTADEQFTVVQAVATRDGKILAVGDSARILTMAGPNTRKIDLKGKTVTPGLIDTHYHLDDYAMRDRLLQEKNIQWEGKVIRAALWWDDLDMALRDVKRAVEAAKPGELVWMIARNEMRHIIAKMRMEQLDAIAPANPLIISGPIRLGAWAVNTRALEWARIPPDTPGIPRDGRVEIRGYRVGAIFDQALEWAVPIEQQIPWHKKRQAMANSWGLTLVETRIEPSHFSAIREMYLDGEMTIRWRVSFPGDADPTRVGNVSDIGDDMLRITGTGGGISIGPSPMAGGVWSFTRRLKALPGDEDDEQMERSQTLRMKQSGERLLSALRYGWSTPNTHVIGDRSAYEFLKVIEEAVKTPIIKTKHQRLTIDHNLQVRPQEIQKMKELGVKPSIAPWFLFTEQNITNNTYMFGADKVAEMLPIKSYIAAGLRPSLESDSGDAPLGKPFWKVQRAIARKDDKDGRVWNSGEKVTRQQALWMTTKWSAEHTGDQDKLGSLEVGKLADLVVLGKDYMTIPEDEIGEIPVLLTMVGGRIVHEKTGSLD